ncbi:hypothetical protein Bbelb_138580 [Branchiostoma belcheri]|nr:hypothetical protein Bbelb_138580 [Branchiostoma belcheri]
MSAGSINLSADSLSSLDEPVQLAGSSRYTRHTYQPGLVIISPTRLRTPTDQAQSTMISVFMTDILSSEGKPLCREICNNNRALYDGSAAGLVRVRNRPRTNEPAGAEVAGAPEEQMAGWEQHAATTRSRNHILVSCSPCLSYSHWRFSLCEMTDSTAH